MIDSLIRQIVISLNITGILLLVLQFEEDWEALRVWWELRALLKPSYRGRHQEEALLTVHLHRSQSHVAPSTETLGPVCVCKGDEMADVHRAPSYWWVELKDALPLACVARFSANAITNANSKKKKKKLQFQRTSSWPCCRWLPPLLCCCGGCVVAVALLELFP